MKLSRLILVLVGGAGLAGSVAFAGPIGPPSGAPYDPTTVILSSPTLQSGKKFYVSSATVSSLTASTVTARAIILNGVVFTTAPISGTSVYPATATIIVPYGFLASTGVFTGTITGTSITVTGLFSGATIHGSSAVITGTITGSNLTGTNTGDVTIGSANGLSLSAQILSMTQGSSSSTGTITALDWRTFNNKLSTTGNGSGLTGLTKTQVGLSNVMNVDQTDASNLASGQVDPTLLGSGTPSSATYLRGDSNWITLNSTAVGLGHVTNNQQVKIADYTQKGAILVGLTPGVFSVLAPGSDGQIISADSATSIGIKYVTSPTSFTVYPATATAGFPKGFSASTGTFTGNVTAGGALTVSGLLTGTTVYASSGSFTGTLNASNLTGTNSGDVTVNATNGLSVAAQVLNIASASATQNGALTSTDWSRFDAKESSFSASSPILLSGGVISIDKSSATLLGPSPTTSVISEGSRLYFTTARATGSISAPSPLSYSNGVVGVDVSSVTLQGNTFNGNSQLVKTTSGGLLPALSAANLTSIPAANVTGTLNISSGTITNFTATASTITSMNATNLTTTNGTMTNATATNLTVATTTIGTTVIWKDSYKQSSSLVISVKDPPYNATGDGTTDDSAAISAAVAAAVANGSGRVFMPGGTYKACIDVGNDLISFEGIEGNTVWKSTNSTCFSLAYHGIVSLQQRVYVKNITFTGSATVGRGVYLNTTGFITFENCRFVDLEYGVYSNGTEWVHSFNTWWKANTYGYIATTKNSDVIGNNPVFPQNAAAHYFSQCSLWSNHLAFYSDSPANPYGDDMYAFTFNQSDFLSNDLAIGLRGGVSIQYPLSLNWVWFEVNGSGGTQSFNGNTLTNGDIDMAGGQGVWRDIAFGGDVITLSSGAIVSGDQINLLSGTTVNITTECVVNFSNLTIDENGGKIYDRIYSTNLRNFSANRAAGSLTTHKTAFSVAFSTKNVIDVDAIGNNLPAVSAGSPTRSIFSGDGLYDNNQCVKVSGVVNDEVYFQDNPVHANAYYVTTFAVKLASESATNTLNIRNGGSVGVGVFATGTLHLTKDWETYGVIGVSSTSGNAQMYFQLGGTMAILISCVQSIEFNTLHEAQTYLNSNTFSLYPDNAFTLTDRSTTTYTGLNSFKGITDGSNASAGNYAEYGSSATANNITLSNGQYSDVVSNTFTAGDWDIEAIICYSGAVTATSYLAGLGTSAGNSASGLTSGQTAIQTSAFSTAAADSCIALPRVRKNPSTSTTYYLKATAAFSVGTQQAYGSMTWRRAPH